MTNQIASVDQAGTPADARVGPLPLPLSACLWVGVTAHRDPPAEVVPMLEHRVREVLERLQAAHPALPVAVMSGLAEGGDRIVARCALEMGLPVLAVLPMPEADYARDCRDAASVDELQRLLRQCLVVTLPMAEGNTADARLDPGPARNRQYTQLGVFISSHCQLLLALWDGKASEAPGGTSDVVQYHLHGDMPMLGQIDEPPNLLADDDSDLVFHIACPRDRPDGAVVVPQATRWLIRSMSSDGDGPMPAHYVQLFRQLGEFNADARRYASDIKRDSPSALPDAATLPGVTALHRIDVIYRQADWLALHFKKRVHHSMALLHVLAVLTGLLLMTYAEFVAHPVLMGATLGLFASGALVAWLGQRRAWHRRYLDYRVLAEGLRVQLFWAIAGVPSSRRVRFAYDSFLQKQDVELGWIRHAMRGVALGDEPSIGPAGLRWVLSHWVGEGGDVGQLGYFRRRTVERERKYQQTERIGHASLALSLACAITLLLAGHLLSPFTGKLLLVLTGVAALFAGVREAYSHKLADKELIKQYRFMTRIFDRAAALTAGNQNEEEQRRVLEALGEAALEEHAEWILMHRERPLESGRLG